MHRRAAASDGSLSPRLGQPNSGLPEFGRNIEWSKSDISDFGGEGWGEGPTLSVLGFAPHPTPLPVRTAV
jgi:hypothetical protein